VRKVGESRIERDPRQWITAMDELAPRAPSANLESIQLWGYAKISAKRVWNYVRSNAPPLGPFLQWHDWILRKGSCQLFGPTTERTARRQKTERKMSHRIQGIRFGDSDQKIRIVNTKMPFHGIAKPRQAQYLQRARSVVDIHMTVETAVKQDITGLCRSAARETGLG
jgi:hypothetical protein